MHSRQGPTDAEEMPCVVYAASPERSRELAPLMRLSAPPRLTAGLPKTTLALSGTLQGSDASEAASCTAQLPRDTELQGSRSHLCDSDVGASHRLGKGMERINTGRG